MNCKCRYQFDGNCTAPEKYKTCQHTCVSDYYISLCWQTGWWPKRPGIYLTWRAKSGLMLLAHEGKHWIDPKGDPDDTILAWKFALNPDEENAVYAGDLNVFSVDIVERRHIHSLNAVVHIDADGVRVDNRIKIRAAGAGEWKGHESGNGNASDSDS